jgi:hypothetical protein
MVNSHADAVGSYAAGGDTGGHDGPDEGMK